MLLLVHFVRLSTLHHLSHYFTLLLRIAGPSLTEKGFFGQWYPYSEDHNHAHWCVSVRKRWVFQS